QSDENIVNAFRSYDRLGRLLSEGLASYVLMTSRKRSDLSREDLYRLNLDRVTNPLYYAEVFEDDWTYGLEWIPKERSKGVPAKKTPRAETHLIFTDEGGYGRELARVMEARGARPILVRRGESFGRTSAGEWTLREGADEDYRRLMDDVFSGDGPAPRSVVHLFGLDAGVDGESSLEELAAAIFRSCGTALHLAGALAKKRPSSSPRLWLVTRNAVGKGAAEAEAPLAQSALWGFGRVFSLEHPELWGGLVDLGEAPGGSVAERLFLELEDSQGEDQISLSSGSRSVARLVRRRVPSAPISDLSPEGSYLVTGGLGALGLRAAQWLASRGAKNLILTGRSGAASESAREAIRELERSGCRVQVERTDVAEPSEVERLLEAIGKGSAPLRGVVHAAGIGAFDRVEEMTWPKMEGVLRAKVAGTWNLDRFTRDLPLDFFVCFSSISSVWGTEGAAHYAAANAFLDAYARDRRARGRAVTSVNWGPWAGGGMATESFLEKLSLIGVEALAPRESMELLGRILVAGSAQTVVARVDWSRFKEIYGLRGKRSLFDAVGRVTAAVRPAEAASSAARVERVDADSVGDYVREKVGVMLGFSDADGMDLRSPLIELGFDSLMAVRLRNAIKSDLGLDVSIGQLFVEASLEKLAGALRAQMALDEVMASPTMDSPEGVDVEAL
ncbi:MAG: SDR family NAD(P)-dependent oxidoreductase, partial [Vicinamibacteria bacterium]